MTSSYLCNSLTESSMISARSTKKIRYEAEGVLYFKRCREKKSGALRFCHFDGEELIIFNSQVRTVRQPTLYIIQLRAMCHVGWRNDSNDPMSSFEIITTSGNTFLFNANTNNIATQWISALLAKTIEFRKLKNAEHNSGINIVRKATVTLNKAERMIVLTTSDLEIYESEENFNAGIIRQRLDPKVLHIRDPVKEQLLLTTQWQEQLKFIFNNFKEAWVWYVELGDLGFRSIGSHTDISREIVSLPGNEVCADCSAKDPTWVAIDKGIVVCYLCSGIHRGISKVFNLTADDRMTVVIRVLLKSLGNLNINSLLEANLSNNEKITRLSDMETRSTFIMEKYTVKKWARQIPGKSFTELQAHLYENVKTGDLVQTVHLIISGAKPKLRQMQSWTTAWEIAREAGQVTQMELLRRNDGAPEDMLSRPLLCGYEMIPCTKTGRLKITNRNSKESRSYLCRLEYGFLRLTPEDIITDGLQTLEMSCLNFTAVYSEKRTLYLVTMEKIKCVIFEFDDLDDLAQWRDTLAHSFVPRVCSHLLRERFVICSFIYTKEWLGDNEWKLHWAVLANKQLHIYEKNPVFIRTEDLRSLHDIELIKECDANSFDYVCLTFSRRKRILLRAERRGLTTVWCYLLKKEAVTFANSCILQHHPLTETGIPVVLAGCLEYIEYKGITNPGLYQTPVDDKRIGRILNLFHRCPRGVNLLCGEMNGKLNVHCVTEATKRFLQSLLIPILSEEDLVEMEHWTLDSTAETSTERLKNHLSRLDRVNFATLRRLLLHFRLVADFSVNGCDTRLLTNIFAPILTKVDCSNNSTKCHNSRANVIVHHLLAHLFALFEAAEDDFRKMRHSVHSFLQMGDVNSVKSVLRLEIYVTENNESMPLTLESGSTPPEIIAHIYAKLQSGSDPMKKTYLLETFEEKRLIRRFNDWEDVGAACLRWPEKQWKTGKLFLESNQLLSDCLEMKLNSQEIVDLECTVHHHCTGSRRNAVKIARLDEWILRLAQKRSEKAGKITNQWNLETLQIYLGADSTNSSESKWSLTLVDDKGIDGLMTHILYFPTEKVYRSFLNALAVRDCL